jgi:hypothetical protein
MISLHIVSIRRVHIINACQGSHRLAYTVCLPWPDPSPLYVIDTATVRSRDCVYALVCMITAMSRLSRSSMFSVLIYTQRNHFIINMRCCFVHVLIYILLLRTQQGNHRYQVLLTHLRNVCTYPMDGLVRLGRHMPGI